MSSMDTPMAGQQSDPSMSDQRPGQRPETSNDPNLSSSAVTRATAATSPQPLTDQQPSMGPPPYLLQWQIKLIYALVYGPLWLAVHLLFRVEVRGAQNMPRSGPVIIVANHLTMLDPLLIGLAFRRRLYYMAKIELQSVPVVGWVLGHFNTYYVKRGQADREAIRQSEAFLRHGQVVALFPEGHRSETGGLQEGQDGVVFLARRSRAPILPVGITGTEKVRLTSLWKRTRISVVVGQPFTLSTSGDRATRRAEARSIMTRVADLLPTEYRGVFVDAGQQATEDNSASL